MPLFGYGTLLGANGPPPPSDPLGILGSLAWWVRADQGITVATGVSQWNDLSGNGVNFGQAAGASQPTFVASAVNGQPAVQFDGTADHLYAAFVRSTPSVQPFYWWCVAKQISWTNNEYLLNDCGATLYSNPTTPNLRQWDHFNGPTNSGAVVGSYVRHEAQWTNSTSDYYKIGSTSVSGVNVGNDGQAGAGYIVMAAGFTGGVPATPIGFGRFEIAEALCFLGTPTAQQRADLDAYCTARYGAGLV